jgi:hypothetical protein
MKINRKILLVVITLVIAFAGCGKYDDGPKFSPWPKKWRLDGTWKIDSYVINGTSVSPTSNYTY